MENAKGFISRIQRYSTKDGPGLRSTVFLVGCNLKCKWCANPELLEAGPKVMYFEERCKQCGACVAIAANSSITFSGNACRIDREHCINIKDCIDVCSYEAYEQVGYEITARELYKKLQRDEAFFKTSGGGVTFSGGEAGLQDEFVYETARLLREDGIHVALDTAGLLSWEQLERLLGQIDLVLYDIKTYDAETHKRCTGVDNALILKNAQRIAAMNKPMLIRMVLVPSMNDDLDDIKARFQFSKDLKEAVQQIDILKYHTFGLGKYLRLGMKYPLKDIPECEDGFIERVRQLAKDCDLKATIGG